jgi:hypothetical protein
MVKIVLVGFVERERERERHLEQVLGYMSVSFLVGHRVHPKKAAEKQPGRRAKDHLQCMLLPPLLQLLCCLSDVIQ